MNEITIVGIDLAKHVFALRAVAPDGRYRGSCVNSMKLRIREYDIVTEDELVGSVAILRQAQSVRVCSSSSSASRAAQTMGAMRLVT
jgi:hypothetical protein